MTIKVTAPENTFQVYPESDPVIGITDNQHLQEIAENLGYSGDLVGLTNNQLLSIIANYMSTEGILAAAPVQSVNGLTGAVVLAEEVQQYANLAAFPATGAAGAIYIAQDTGKLYRWVSAGVYAELAPSPEEVQQYANLAAFPATGEAAALYIAADTGLVYRWNGAAYVEVGGSGGVSYFESLEYTAAPNNVRYCILWRADPTGGVDADICLQPFGQGALLANPPDGTATYGNKRGVRAVDWQMERTAATQVASGNNSVVGGGFRNSSTGQYCVVGGGYTNTAQGQASVVAGGDTNTITSTSSSYSTISGGTNNNITGTSRQYCTISGGSGNSIEANYAAISGGASNTISAGATRSVVSGGDSNSIGSAGTAATIGGGEHNSVNANRATVCGGAYNTSSGDSSTTSGGGNTASGTSAIAMGNGCVASGMFASIALGQGSTASAVTAVAIGGSVIADGNYSTALGQYSQTFGVGGAIAHSSGRVTTTGDVQTRSVTLFTQTTNATPSVLRTTTSAVSSSNILNNRNYTLQAIKGRCIARTPGSTVDYAVWEFTALLNRGANAASSALLILLVTPALLASGGTGGTWGLSVTADTTNGGLLVTGTGEAGKTITWGCDLNALEVQDLS